MTYDAQSRFQTFQRWVMDRCFIDGEDPEASPDRIRIRTGNGRSFSTQGKVPVTTPDETWAAVVDELDNCVPPTLATTVRLELLDKRGNQLSGRQRPIDADASHDYEGAVAGGESLEGAHGLVVNVMAGLIRDLTAGHVQTNRELVRRAHDAEAQVRGLFGHLVEQEREHTTDQAAAMVAAASDDSRRQVMQLGMQLAPVLLAQLGKGKSDGSPTPGNSKQNTGEPNADDLKAWAVANPGAVLELLQELPEAVRHKLGEQLSAA